VAPSAPGESDGVSEPGELDGSNNELLSRPLLGAPALAGPVASDGEIADLLEKTSRTFALAIPLLPSPTREQVGIAYLLFRIADTFEDAEQWGRQEKLDGLEAFGALLKHPDSAQAHRDSALWAQSPPCENRAYRELLERTPWVLGAFENLTEPARSIVRDHTLRTVDGMASFVSRAEESGRLELGGIDDLRAYCYVVAGIVGEMLTELFLDGRPELIEVAEPLRQRAARFGEALQLVNIVKDAFADAHFGRHFLPAGCDIAEVFSLARRDVEVAREYVLMLQRAGAPRGLVAFTALPILLASGALARVEANGPGAKLSRTDVAEILATLEVSLDNGRPAV
jgi:farnesyl-diphosphate farnesyltransferase